ADPAVVSRVSVNTVDATEEGDVWTAKIPDPGSNAVTVNVTLANDNATAVVTHEAGTHGTAASTAPNAQGVWTFNMSDEEKAVKEAKFLVWDENGAESGKEYTVKFDVNDGSDDVSIKSITVDTQYGETVVDGDTYTITLPYNTSGPQTLKVEVNHKNAYVDGQTPNTTGIYEVTSGAITDGASTTTITIKNGATAHVYTVKTVNAAAFAAFSVAGERKEAKIDTEHKTVTVYMPYGSNTDANGNFKITPTFTPGYASVDIKAVKTDSSKVALESGKEINLKDYLATLAASKPLNNTGNSDLSLKISYSDVGTAEPWTVEFDVPANDPAPVLKDLYIGTFKAEIDEAKHTAVLNVPKTLRVSTAKLMGLASPGATILLTDVDTVVAQKIAATPVAKLLNTATDGGTTAVDFGIATKNNFIIRVTAAGDENGVAVDAAHKGAVQDYKLTINTVDSVGTAEITEMILEDNSDAKNQYKAEIKDNIITFTLPFATTNDPDKIGAGVVDWKLYYGLSNGTTIEAGTIDEASGLTLDGTEAYLPATFNDNSVKGTPIVVTNGKSTTNYNIAVKLAPARTANSMTNFKATTKDDFADIIDNENAFAATGSSDLLVTVPYSKYNDFKTGPFVNADVSDGAVVYYVDKDDKLQAVDIVKDGATTATHNLPATDSADLPYDGVKEKPAGTKGKLTLVVVNEKGAVNADGTAKITAGTTLSAALEVGTFRKYVLTVKQAAAQKQHVLDSFSVYDSVTKTEIPANVDSRNHKITLTLPASFVGTKAAAGGANASDLTGGMERNLWFNYGTSHYESVSALDNTDTAIGTAGVKKLTIKDGAVVTADSTDLMVATNNSGVGELKMADATTNTAIAKIRVESEAYNAGTPDEGGYQEYDLVVKYEAVKLGCTLNSVTINGVTAKPDANGKVTVTLPKATELTGLKPTFNVSEGANVSSQKNLGANNANLITSGSIMNFTQPKSVWVLSENGANTQKYTIEVKIDDGFSDVKPGDWFYSYVMDASKRGIIIGNGDGTFGPHTNVTRVQFATMMARVDGFDASAWEDKPSQFSDMNGITGEAAAAVAYCADKGYITGDGGSTTFRPNDTISRQEMAVIISRVMKLDVENVEIGIRFADDAKIAGWAKNYVYACVNAKMLMGEGDNTFNPLGSTTRAAAATAAVRVDDAK
ncbi:S-layer homology domain-containing protein, partial [Acutalibacter sp. JLR.KK004]|uniref:S-layer homology domain-containing protein n=1 Tax=Acutalibacter sp. JLR.KK004 TaxID=3112622 RepID=UPI002FF265CD